MAAFFNFTLAEPDFCKKNYFECIQQQFNPALTPNSDENDISCYIICEYHFLFKHSSDKIDKGSDH